MTFFRSSQRLVQLWRGMEVPLYERTRILCISFFRSLHGNLLLFACNSCTVFHYSVSRYVSSTNTPAQWSSMPAHGEVSGNAFLQPLYQQSSPHRFDARRIARFGHALWRSSIGGDRQTHIRTFREILNTTHRICSPSCPAVRLVLAFLQVQQWVLLLRL